MLIVRHLFLLPDCLVWLLLDLLVLLLSFYDSRNVAFGRGQHKKVDKIEYGLQIGLVYSIA
jgi:hypothetical protein